MSKQGFEVLPPIKDGKRSAMLGGVRDAVRRLNAAGAGVIGFIYYSGHGAAEKDININYLIPVDASAPGTSAFWDDSVKLDDVLRLFDGARSAAKFIVFDACRNELQLPTKDTSVGGAETNILTIRGTDLAAAQLHREVYKIDEQEPERGAAQHSTNDPATHHVADQHCECARIPQ